MSGIVVEPVSTRRQRKAFLNYPWQLYHDDPHWVPPLRHDQAEMVGYLSHPFYEQNEAQTFLAYRDGQVCGRISAIHNRDHVRVYEEPRGYFGFFECVDNQEVAEALFVAARRWLAGRGLTCLRGPMNPGVNYTLGTLVEGFDATPTFMMTYNPPYYDRLLTGCGLRKSQDFYAYTATTDLFPKASEKLFPLADQIQQRYGVTTRPIDKSRFQADVEDFMRIYNLSMAQHWGFLPMSPAEIQHSAKGLRQLMVPELAAAVEVDGKMVGAALVLPDYNPRIKRIDGRLFPFGFLRLLWNKRSIKKARCIAANVLPEYQLLGIILVLSKEMLSRGIAWEMEEVEYSWVAESNRQSRGSLEKIGTRRVKTYRIYDWDPA